MTNLMKKSFVWQFTGGFVLGTIGLLAIQPAEAREALRDRIAPSHQVR